jgi:hypothetical protein
MAYTGTSPKGWQQKHYPHKFIFNAFLRKSHSPMEPLLWLIHEQVQRGGSKHVTHTKNIFDAFLRKSHLPMEPV